MPRVVPSDVVKAADRIFAHMVTAPHSFPSVGPDGVPRLMALADLVDAVAPELVTLEPEQYAELVACVAYMRALDKALLGGHRVIDFNLVGYDRNPVAIVRAAMAACPDEAPAPGTRELQFITDADLRQSIRLDMSAASSNLAQGEWKGATVLAGAAVEALLLWALQERDRKQAGSVAAGVAALRPKTFNRDPGPDLEGPGWHLHEYVEVAAHLKLIEDDTATQVRLAKNFRNLIHPGRAARLNQKCDRATALGALAAVEAVARDLTP
jgi:hypothetical protein